MKRIFDILLALALALPALVGVGLCWVLVRIDSAGPVIFKQIRVGRDGVFFTFYKIRTMRIETAELPSHEASASSVTHIGALLRPFKFDELPQIWNVIKGDMSFVGPRPSLPSQTELVEARRLLGVLKLRPGITGWAQVQGIDMSEPQRLARVDADYMRRQSLWRDCNILVLTLFGGGRGDRTR